MRSRRHGDHQATATRKVYAPPRRTPVLFGLVNRIHSATPVGPRRRTHRSPVTRRTARPARPSACDTGQPTMARRHPTYVVATKRVRSAEVGGLPDTGHSDPDSDTPRGADGAPRRERRPDRVRSATCTRRRPVLEAPPGRSTAPSRPPGSRMSTVGMGVAGDIRMRPNGRRGTRRRRLVAEGSRFAWRRCTFPRASRSSYLLALERVATIDSRAFRCPPANVGSSVSR